MCASIVLYSFFMENCYFQVAKYHWFSEWVGWMGIALESSLDWTDSFEILGTLHSSQPHVQYLTFYGLMEEILCSAMSLETSFVIPTPFLRNHTNLLFGSCREWRRLSKFFSMFHSIFLQCICVQRLYKNKPLSNKLTSQRQCTKSQCIATDIFQYFVNKSPILN